MNNTDVPIWEKYTLTVEEASKYFRIGEKKLRKLAEENLDAGWVIVNGNRIQIKRKQFEKIQEFAGGKGQNPAFGGQSSADFINLCEQTGR